MNNEDVETSPILTDKGKKAFLKALNERFCFTKEGKMIPKNEDSYDPIILSDYYDGNENVR